MLAVVEQARSNFPWPFLEAVSPVAVRQDPCGFSFYRFPAGDRKGDVVRGHVVFTTLGASCHKFEKEGIPLGPERTGIAARARREFLSQQEKNRPGRAGYPKAANFSCASIR